MIVRIPVRLEHQSLPTPAMNVWHCRTVEGLPGATGDVANCLDALEEMYRYLGGIMPNGTSVTMGEGMIADPLGDPTYFPDDARTFSATTGPAGTASPILAIVASWRTTSASRSGRGRTFFGPIVTGMSDENGTPTAAALSAVKTATESLLSESQGPGGWALGVLSTKQGILRDFTGVSVRDRFAFLSSRRA